MEHIFVCAAGDTPSCDTLSIDSSHNISTRDKFGLNCTSDNMIIVDRMWQCVVYPWMRCDLCGHVGVAVGVFLLWSCRPFVVTVESRSCVMLAGACWFNAFWWWWCSKFLLPNDHYCWVSSVSRQLFWVHRLGDIGVGGCLCRVDRIVSSYVYAYPMDLILFTVICIEFTI